MRASSHAISSPRAAVSGAAIAASLTVVKKEFQAVPAQTIPNAPHSSEKAVRKCASVGV